MYYDWTYLVLVLPAVIFAMWASYRVNSTFKRYSTQWSSRRVPAEAVARMVLDRNGLRHIPIEQISGNLTDHYDPKANVIRLSDSVRPGTRCSTPRATNPSCCVSPLSPSPILAPKWPCP